MTNYQEKAGAWSEQQRLAEELIPLIGALYRGRQVVTSLHGRSLINRSTTELLKAHRFARRVQGVEVPLEETLAIVRTLTELQPGASSVDVAHLGYLYRTEGGGESLEEFLRRELAPVLGTAAEVDRPARDVVLYGFGRIGRLVARILVERGSEGSRLRLRAIVVRKGSVNDLRKRASLLERDSVHGPFSGTVTVDEENNALLVNGTLVHVIYSDAPDAVDYSTYGIKNAVVVDNTGRWRDEEGLSQHLAASGVDRVLLTAPGKGALKNIVHGINQDTITDSDRIITAASCTTNAIAPVLKLVHEFAGIVSGHVETVHSFTNDQNLIDNFHGGDRRGRSAALNMVITETGAATAVAKALPEMTGRLTGSSVRVPTPDVSLAILYLRTDRPVLRDEVNAMLRSASLNSPLRRQIDYVESPEIVSSDILGTRHAGVVDGLATVATPDHLILYVWYDNEFGYSCQVVRVLEDMAGVRPRTLPAPRWI